MQTPSHLDKINIITNNDGIFNVYIYVQAGPIYERKGIFGISHFLEHMLMKRTKKYDMKELYKKMTFIGGMNNAGTYKDVTYYYICTHVDNYKDAVDMIKSIVTEPKFTKEEMEMEKKVVLEELATRLDSIDDQLYFKSTFTVLPSSNEYSRRIIGKAKDIKGITIDDLNAYYKKTYSKYIVIANVDKKHLKEVEPYLIKTFGKNIPVDFTHSKEQNLTFQAINKKPKILILEKDTLIQYSTIMAFPTPSIYDVKKRVVINFIRFILTSSGSNSILFQKLREERGLIYSIHTICEDHRGQCILRITYSSSNEDTKFIMSLIMDCIEDLKNKDLENLEYWKDSMVNKNKYLFSNVGVKEAWYCNIIFYQINITQEEFFKYISGITAEDVKIVTKELFDFSRMGVSTLGNYKNADKLTKEIEDLRKTYQK